MVENERVALAIRGKIRHYRILSRLEASRSLRFLHWLLRQSEEDPQ